MRILNMAHNMFNFDLKFSELQYEKFNLPPFSTTLVHNEYCQRKKFNNPPAKRINSNRIILNFQTHSSGDEYKIFVRVKM